MKARLLVTKICNKNCENCCNKQLSFVDIPVITDFSQLITYDVVNITGGEPMLRPDRTLTVVKQLKSQNSQQKIYLYTSHMRCTCDYYSILPYIDGLTFTLHEGITDHELLKFTMLQDYLADMLPDNSNKSCRLNIDINIKKVVLIWPCLWSSVEFITLTDSREAAEAPEGEKLLLLDEALYYNCKRLYLI